MDRRLFEAARTGNVDYLLKLIEGDSLMLDAVALAGGETPLHVASMAGHLGFVNEIIKLRKEFAQELNQDGFSPLHVASANGYIEIVIELLKVGHDLCLLKGRERRIPLHYAAMKGRVLVLEELISACPESVEGITARGETVIHLAVKNNQFDAFKVLVEHLMQLNKEDVLNKKDDQGNTILHFAVSKKQYEVIDFVLGEHTVSKGVVEVNSLNNRGLTALDVLLLFQSEEGDREIEEILRRAGAMRAEDLIASSTPIQSNQIQVLATNASNDQSSQDQQSLSPVDELVEYFKYKKSRDSPSDVRNSLLVIATLIVTTTYQAVLSPPAGVWQDDSGSSNITTNTTTKPHSAGKAIMGSHNSISYGLFLFFNSLGFFTSIDMIIFLTSGFPLQLMLQISVVALIVTYDTSMTAIAPNSGISFFFTVISIVLPFIIPLVRMVVTNYLKRARKVIGDMNRTSIYCR